VYLRQGKAWVGIGRDRAAAAAAIASHVDLFLLDDGFQHWRLHRDFDIVLLDELDPHAGGGVFPAGLLREPPSALGRADAVITVRKRAADVVPAGAWEAFCGIGNPGSFLATLRAGRAHLVDFIRLGDHQAHLPAKIRHSSNIWLTTAKDAARFPELGDRLRVVPIRVELPDPAGLLERILRICGGKSDGRTA
jgi:tetraacyldisaccharide-1-P 4'-kinase